MKPKGRKLRSEKVVFFEIEELREHEEIRPDYVEELKNEILNLKLIREFYGISAKGPMLSWQISIPDKG